LLAFVVISLLAGCGAPANRANTYEKQGRQTAAGGIYKIGTPYQIMGSWYYPRENPNYDEVGIASWYGSKFHGRRTANGEIFDMNLLTAAHPTLPMPVRARVTNLENGKSIIVRINDRGPFAKDREIDLSRKAAEVLGFRDKGTTRVRVQYLGRAPMYDSAGRLIRGQEPASFIAEKPRTPDENKRVAAAPVEQVEKQTLDGRTIADAPPPIASKRYAVQVGVFSSRFNAERLKRQLDRITPAEVSEAEINGETYYRVKVGGANVREDARQTRDMLVSAGHQDAVIVEQ
ncbi:MAG: septal ring lytic transglycosylase RlpA family protein, partial [Pseudomonadota bacterium]|nr:septal ring lytic transglycosylase RlpA family protein [Pseudomonadota bacterium]